jgi:hypothetical protein
MDIYITMHLPMDMLTYMDLPETQIKSIIKEKIDVWNARVIRNMLLPSKH